MGLIERPLMWKALVRINKVDMTSEKIREMSLAYAKAAKAYALTA